MSSSCCGDARLVMPGTRRFVRPGPLVTVRGRRPLKVSYCVYYMQLCQNDKIQSKASSFLLNADQPPCCLCHSALLEVYREGVENSRTVGESVPRALLRVGFVMNRCFVELRHFDVAALPEIRTFRRHPAERRQERQEGGEREQEGAEDDARTAKQANTSPFMPSYRRPAAPCRTAPSSDWVGVVCGAADAGCAAVTATVCGLHG